MKKIYNFILIVLILGVTFFPLKNAEAASSYSVEMVSGSSSNRVVGNYNSYGEALNVMNSQSSSDSSVATIYRNGVPVDSKYGIFKFKPNGVYKLYQNSNSSSSYTSISSSSGVDAALLGYSDNGRVKIMISGFIGYTDINNGVVTPISLLSGNMINVNGGGVRLRTNPSLSASTEANISGSYNFNYTETRDADGYTWYKINYNGKELWVAGGSWVSRYNSSLGTYYLNYGPTGNLIHHFEIYSGVSYTDSFTNLGTSPSFLTPDVRYYSFDGNYFYSNITSMLDDYRIGDYGRSVNANNPYYSYYLYLTAHSTTGYTADDLNNIIASRGYNASSSKLYGTGADFKEAESVYGTNALLAFSTALNESNWGSSSIAMNKNNLFGYGAYDSCPYDCAYSYSSPRESIMSYATSAASSYEAVTGKYYFGSHYGNKNSGKNIMYATDPYWGEKMAMNAFIRDKNYGGKDFNSNTIGVVRKSTTSAWVFDRPIQDAKYLLYKQRNQYSSNEIHDFAINIVDKVENNGVWFYKIYTDIADRNPQYGYVWADEWNVSNNQPVINALDREIKIGDGFDYLSDVSATDIENGDLTSKITYEGNVDTSKEGTYKVKYTVADNSNFHVSKEIEVKVLNDNVPIIEAEDKEITQFDEFNYLDGVKAYNKDSDLTDKITYSKTVDTSKEGIYEVIYKVNNDGRETTKKINVKVNKNEKPLIEASDIEITYGDDIDLLKGVTASDKEDGDLTDYITYKGEYDTKKIGTYEITYFVSDKNNQEVNKKITLKVVKDEEPIINAKDREIIINKEFNPLEGVTAHDKEDGDITSKLSYEGIVDTSKEGSYLISYSVSDSKKQIAIKTINVNVVKKNLKESSGEFYLDYLKEVNGSLQIKGYNTIKAIDNTLENEITYELILINEDTGKEYTQKLERVKDLKEIYLTTPSEEGKNYTYSWFTGNISLKDIKQGNYKLYVISKSDDYYFKSIVSNKLLGDQTTDYNNDGKHLTITNDYLDKSSPIVFTVRDKKIGKKETSPYTNQYSYLEDIAIKDSKLYIRGASYSSGLDMGMNTDLERSIIFENTESFETYSFNLGYIENGTFTINLLGTDEFGKAKPRAWYDQNIDISDLPKGNYVIYIKNKSNIEDYGELKDILLYADYSKAKGVINDKNYSFKLNSKRNYRVELNVE